MRTEDEEGNELFVAVSDSPGRGLDLRGWDRPDPGMRALVEIVEAAEDDLEEDQRANALKTKVRRVQPTKSAGGARQRKQFSQLYIDAKKQVFELNENGWFYQNMRVATAIAQKLRQRREAGLLRPLSR